VVDGRHVDNGIGVACIAAIAVADDETVTRGRHAAVAVPQPSPPPGSLFQPYSRWSTSGSGPR
jgi:hypothetical protein